MGHSKGVFIVKTTRYSWWNLYFILDGKSIFSDYANLKLNKATTKGISVGSKTGQVYVINKGQNIDNLKSTDWRKKQNGLEHGV